ncbi:hypothetical protein DRH27_06030 [Candidatus Falkowbacteria bacterium]|nr:MAG: hypothetical protein DRH27_06030 [Candidatus Falkowbacteria bacterium]
MKYIEFQRKFKNYPIISLIDVRTIFPDFDHRRFYEWQKKGYIKKVINNFYIFSDKELSDSEMNFIANKLYEPSYLSLEYALNYYSLIPEVVFLRTSVTTKKTKKIQSEINNFSYQKIKKDIFFGYKIIKAGNISYKIAEPEKAILDFFYLRKDINTSEDIYELRVNKISFKETVSQKKLREYLKIYNSKKLKQKLKILNNLMKE